MLSPFVGVFKCHRVVFVLSLIGVPLLRHAWIGCKYLRGKKSQSKKTKLLNEKLVKFDCCRGRKMIAK